jgi:hypothetical protein
MNQTRLGSFIEALINTAIGLVVSVIANAFVFPLFGFNPTPAQSVSISAIYTGISIVRQYTLRRWFNKRLHAAAMRAASVIKGVSHA